MLTHSRLDCGQTHRPFFLRLSQRKVGLWDFFASSQTDKDKLWQSKISTRTSRLDKKDFCKRFFSFSNTHPAVSALGEGGHSLLSHDHCRITNGHKIQIRTGKMVLQTEKKQINSIIVTLRSLLLLLAIARHLLIHYSCLARYKYFKCAAKEIHNYIFNSNGKILLQNILICLCCQKALYAYDSLLSSLATHHRWLKICHCASGDFSGWQSDSWCEEAQRGMEVGVEWQLTCTTLWRGWFLNLIVRT